MINEIEYIYTVGTKTTLIRADKDVSRRGAWHLASIDGNGLPDVSAMGGTSYGVAGASYTGLAIDARTITVKLYADAYGIVGLQQMMHDGALCASLNGDGLGLLRLRNAAGEWYRIAARCVAFEIEKQYMRSALVRLDFHCPYVWFEDDAETCVPIIAVQGGKEYDTVQGLQRPYMFGNYSDITTSSSGACRTIEVVNLGDVPAPLTLDISGASISSVSLSSIEGGGTSYNWRFEVIKDASETKPNEVRVCSDIDNLGCWANYGNGLWVDYMGAVKLGDSSPLTDAVIMPGYNKLTVTIGYTSLAVAGSEIKFRGRYTSCL